MLYQDDIDVPEALTIDTVNEWTDEVATYKPELCEEMNSKALRYAHAVEVSTGGYSQTLWSWSFDSPGGALCDKHRMVCEYTNSVLSALRSDEAINSVSLKRDKRLQLVSFGVVLSVLNDAGYMDVEKMRDWQRELVLITAFFFCSTAAGTLDTFDDNKYYPQFFPFALVKKPTGSGKSFAGILACLCSMIRMDGSDITLLHPRNAKALWCVPTRTLARDISKTFEKIVNTPSFKVLCPANAGNDLTRAYVTVGEGSHSPNVKEKMFCVMTYEYARTHLLVQVLQDPGDRQAKRQPLLVSLRCCVVDEAHYLVDQSDRRLAVDNILLACHVFHIPLLFLTATPSQQFVDYINATYPPCVATRDEDMLRKFDIHCACFAVPSEMTADKSPLAAHLQGDIIAKINKLIAFRCLTETLFSDNATGQRSIFFIQNTRDVLLVACYMTGLLCTLTNKGSFTETCNNVESLSIEYLQVHFVNFDKRYDSRNCKQQEMVDIFCQAISDITGLYIKNQHLAAFYEAVKSDGFFFFLCMFYGIIPYYSSIGLDEGSDKCIRDRIIGSDSCYNVLVTTSVVLEGVNIAGADNLYITPQGYRMITNTQYMQLSGRVGRVKDGYVETWLPVALTPEGAQQPVKSTSTLKREQSANTVRVVETDDLIDRILFLRMLFAYEGSPTMNDCVKKVSTNRITNNYYRGPINPRISEFYVPVSLSESDYHLEINSAQPADFYHSYIEQFVNSRYSLFFNIYSRVTFDPSSPRITLDSISFLLLLSQYSAQLSAIPTTGCLTMSPIFFIPVFTRYSYAIKPREAKPDSITLDIVEGLRSMMVDIARYSSSDSMVKLLNMIVCRVYPGEFMNSKLMHFVETSTVAFAASLLISPDIWHAFTRVRFIDSISYILTYLTTLVSLTSSINIQQELVDQLMFTWQVLRGVIENIRGTLDRYATRGLNNLDTQIEFTVPGLSHVKSTIKLPATYIDYIMQCMHTTSEELTRDCVSTDNLLKDFYRLLPKTTNTF